MLFINHAADAKQAKGYFTEHLSRSDYYTRDAQETVGEWRGLGAELLGLAGRVDKESYFRLCENIHPKTGEPLTARTKAGRRVLYDFTFDAPKSVTLAYELGKDEPIAEAFSQSVRETMADIEGAMRVRVRTHGRQEDRATCNMIWADFTHRTTRPVRGEPDPQLHCHAVTFNATYDPVEDRWKAGQFEQIYRDKGYHQAAFHSRLAEKLVSLGYGVERDGNSFRLAGIDKATVAEFSRRSEVIEAEAQRLGIDDAKAKGELGRRTREAKPDEQKSMAELRRQWQARITDGQRDAIAAARSGQKSNGLTAEKAVAFAVGHVFERASTVTEKKLLQTALIHSVGVAAVKDVHRAAGRGDIIRRDRQGQRIVTTKEVLSEEIAMTTFVRAGKGTRYKLGGGKPHALDPDLSDEQRTAARVILASRDTVTALKGGAGTGKTKMMTATVKAIEAGGKKVFTFAPSAEASHVLRSEGFAGAETVERLLIDPRIQQQAKGQVLWVDEAGLLSVKDMKRLFDVAGAHNARVVLGGDSGQNNSVIRGDALRILEKDSGLTTATLSEIRRQTDKGYAQAVKAIAEGDAIGRDGKARFIAGVEMLDAMGAIAEVEGEGRYRRIAEDYSKSIRERKPGGAFKSALVVSPTHKEAQQATQAIRENLRAGDVIRGKEREFVALRSLNRTEAERADARSYQPGEVIEFHHNAKGFTRGERLTVAQADAAGVRLLRADGGAAELPLAQAKRFGVYRKDALTLAEGDRMRITQNGFTRETRRGAGKRGDRLNNGDVYTVAGFTKAGDIKLANGFVVQKDYGGLAHGYVVTAHASQGKTVDKVLIALGSQSFDAATRESFYVSVSRGREAVKLYTDDKAAMLEAIERSAARLSATELMQRAEVKRKPGFLDRLINAGIVQRAYSAMRQRIAAHRAVQSYDKQRREGMRIGH